MTTYLASHICITAFGVIVRSFFHTIDMILRLTTQYVMFYMSGAYDICQAYVGNKEWQAYGNFSRMPKAK